VGPAGCPEETCETDKRSNEIVASYVLSVQEKLARMSEMMTKNLVKAQNEQKRWYDHHAQQRVCSYHIQLETAGPVAESLSYVMWVPSPMYEINMFDTRKRRRMLASLIVLVKKKDRTMHFCVDYRKPNSVS